MATPQPQFLSYDQINEATGSKPELVQVGSAGSIASGIPVTKALGQRYVVAMATNMPTVGTDYVAGITSSLSTDTASVDGYVDVQRIFDNDSTWLVSPKVAATWDTQAEYDTPVGTRILLDLTAGVYTALASDSANNGCVVEPLDIAKYPGKVRISFRKGLNYLA